MVEMLPVIAFLVFIGAWMAFKLIAIGAVGVIHYGDAIGVLLLILGFVVLGICLFNIYFMYVEITEVWF